MTSQTAPAQLSLRVDLPNGGRLGPGKANLLRAIAEVGSISAAARTLGLSYPKAKKLVDALNTDFDRPLVTARHGGNDRGGAALTDRGAEVLAAYHRIEQAAQASAAADLACLQNWANAKPD